MEQIDLLNEVNRRVQELVWKQETDGSWRYCFEGSPLTDVYFVLLNEILGIKEKDKTTAIVQKYIQRQERDGGWKIHVDQKKSDLSVTIQIYLALRCSNLIDENDERLLKAENYIIQNGGLQEADLMTKFMLCIHNLYPYPAYVYIPPTIFLLKPSMLFSVYDFSAYARVHLAPMIVLVNKRRTFPLPSIPNLEYLMGERVTSSSDTIFRNPFTMKDILESLRKYSPSLYKKAYQEIESFIIDRIEENGTLYTYASSTFYMIYSLLTIGYDKTDPIIKRAYAGIESLYNEKCQHIENSPSTIWDTAYLSYVLQEVGVSPNHESIEKATNFLVSRQHKHVGDWKFHAPNTLPGGWGFSDINKKVPDNDDTSVVLRAIFLRSHIDKKVETSFNKGIEWLLSMQNDDGGWAAFEKNTNQEWIMNLPIQYSKEVLIDPSTPDITGRTLEFLGKYASFKQSHPSINKAISWAKEHQEENGSWYGKWGICYIYGTWAMITGLIQVGYYGDEVRRGCEWLLSIQKENGGWGESCESSVKKQYISLPFSTVVQSAWALHTLIEAGYANHPSVKRGIHYLLNFHPSYELNYPVGTGLPGSFYIHYHSYKDIFPLLTLGRYYQKIYG